MSYRYGASSDSTATDGGDTLVLAAPKDLDVLRFSIGCDDYVVLTFRSPDGKGRAPVPACLTASERAILPLVLHGHSNYAIAELRGTSVSTIANQIYSIYRKIGVKSRRELKAHPSCRTIART